MDGQVDRWGDGHTGVMGGRDREGLLMSKRMGEWMGRYRRLRGGWMDR